MPESECRMCSGEYCAVHQTSPCDCDTADRHGDEQCPLLDAPDNGEVVIDYTNYRGERTLRRIVPQRIWFGETPEHAGPRWLLRAKALDRNGEARDFDLASIHSWRSAEREVP